MIDLRTKRILLVTGKGGVGRTTLTAALAMAAAHLGRRVLVTEVGDPDAEFSPLARLYGRKNFEDMPRYIAPNTRGNILWSRRGHQDFLQTVLPIKTLVKAAMRSSALTKLLDAAPSFNEMGVFYHLLTLLRAQATDGRPEHELIIMDMPATGHTLALTQLPGLLLSLMPTGPIATAFREGQGYLNNPATCGAMIVSLPEHLPVTESLELKQGLEETKVPVGGILMNKVVADEFTEQEHAEVAKLLESHNLYGAGRYRSMRNAVKEIERCKAESGVPVALLPEVAATGKELITALAQTLLAQQPTQGGAQ